MPINPETIKAALSEFEDCIEFDTVNAQQKEVGLSRYENKGRPLNIHSHVPAATLAGVAECPTLMNSSLKMLTRSTRKAQSMFRTLNEKVSVSPQIIPGSNVETAKAEGVTLIVNNRPDGEDPICTAKR